MSVHRVITIALVLVFLGTIAQPLVYAASHSTAQKTPWYGVGFDFFSWLMYLIHPADTSYTVNGPGDSPTPGNGNG